MRTSHRWFVASIIFLCLAAIPVSLIGAGKFRSAEETEIANSDQDFSDYFANDHIAVVRLTGLIAGDDSSSSLWSSSESAGAVLKQLRRAVKNKHVKAVLLRVDSPGGTVSTSQEIADEIKSLRDHQKPVVVSMGDVSASGGYYVACGADKIVADPGTITGSIGVIINSINLKGLADKLGLYPQIIKSGKFKDIGSPYREMTAEDKSILQELINDAYDQFTQAVSTGRHIPLADVKKLADGRIYSGRQALKLKLIDSLGSYTAAIDLLQSICKDRYKLKENLPVKDSNPKNVFSALMEATGFPIAPRFLHYSPLNEINFEAFIPELIKAKYHNQPLWLMP